VQTDPDPHFNLGVVRVPAEFELQAEITADEYASLDAALAALSRLETPFNYLVVERNFLDLQNIHTFVTIIMELGRDFVGQADHRELFSALMRALVNWLTSVRLYLDHTETDLKHRFGKTSTEVREFKTVTAAAYDGRLGYRFCYRLRNYVQHCGLPASRIAVAPARLPRVTRAKQSVDIHVDRDALRADFDGWGPVATDITAMSGTFPLLPLADEAMEGLRDIYPAVRDIGVTDALRHTSVLVSALDQIDLSDGDGQPAIFKHNGDFKGQLQLSPRPLPADFIRQLNRVERGEAHRESLYTTTIPVPPPMFDPSTIRERFHRDSRGVQVLSAWFIEKGATPAFLSAVDRIIAEDGGIEPLLTGLINSNTLLAHIAAISLGATAEGLVSGLLDVYSEFDKPPQPNAG